MHHRHYFRNKYLTMNNAGQKILIVDDEPDILELIEYNLKKRVIRFSQLPMAKKELLLRKRYIQI